MWVSKCCWKIRKKIYGKLTSFGGKQTVKCFRFFFFFWCLDRSLRTKTATLNINILMYVMHLRFLWFFLSASKVSWVIYPSFLSPGSCGSCYSFASMGMMEARIRILTNNTQTPILSPQEVVSCSQYAQGMCCISGTVYLCVVCHCWQRHKDRIVERS